MKILITGAGHLASHLVQRASVEHEVVLFGRRVRDELPWLGREQTYIQGDIRHLESVRRATEGSLDAVIHTAACHPVRAFSEEEYLTTNVQGLHNVLTAAREAGAHRFVFTSSFQVYGAKLKPSGEACAWIDEETPLEPHNLYGLTKVMGEGMLRYFTRTSNLTGIALRIGCFTPCERVTWGLRFLLNGVDVTDVAQACLLAIEARTTGFEGFCIRCDNGFRPEDLAGLAADPLKVIAELDPSAVTKIRRRGLELPAPQWCADVSKARRILGYDPQHNFLTFLREPQGAAKLSRGMP